MSSYSATVFPSTPPLTRTGSDDVPRRGWFQSRFTQVLFCLVILAMLLVAAIAIISIVAARLHTLDQQLADSSRQLAGMQDTVQQALSQSAHMAAIVQRLGVGLGGAAAAGADTRKAPVVAPPGVSPIRPVEETKQRDTTEEKGGKEERGAGGKEDGGEEEDNAIDQVYDMPDAVVKKALEKLEAERSHKHSVLPSDNRLPEAQPEKTVKKGWQNETVPDADRSWMRDNCDFQCHRRDFYPPPLLVLSFDGFSSKFLEKRIVKTLEYMKQCGASTSRVYSSYPSRTFPNHYSIMTGLFPEFHGVYDNFIYEPKLNARLQNLKVTPVKELYGGVPIWRAFTESTGRPTACIFWPGCIMDDTKYAPKNNVKFNNSWNFQQRVDETIRLLLLPKDERPAITPVYFQDPDHEGHRWMPDESNIDAALVKVDKTLDYLFTRLTREGLMGCVNVVVVSDHGMTPLNKTVDLTSLYPNDKSDFVFFGGVVGRVWRNASSALLPLDVPVPACSSEVKFWRKPAIPPRFQTTSYTSYDLLLEGRRGTVVYMGANEYLDVPETMTGNGSHGYDYIDENMQGIFFAFGPSIHRGVVVEPFQNVEYFHLFEELLQFRSERGTNGTVGRLNDVLNRPAILTHKQPLPVRHCQFNFDRVRPCADCERHFKLAALPPHCPLHSLPFESEIHTHSEDTCLAKACDTLFHFLDGTSEEKRGGLVVTEHVRASPVHLPFSNCAYSIEGQCQEGSLHGYNTTSILVNHWDDSVRADVSLVSLHPSLISRFLQPLNQIATRWIAIYGHMRTYSGVVYGKGNLLHSSAPSHFFRVFVRCRSGAWLFNRCAIARETEVFTVLVPNTDIGECGSFSDLLLQYSARIRDIEEWTRIEFFADRLIYPAQLAVNLRTRISDKLWSM